MKILYLCHRIPYPPNKGDKIRSFHQIQYLSKEHEVHLACLVDDREDMQYIKELEKYCVSVDAIYIDRTRARFQAFKAFIGRMPLSIVAFYSRELQERIDKRLNEGCIDIILGFSSAMALYVQKVKEIPKIMDFVDVDSDKWLLYADLHHFPLSWIYRLEARRLAAYEKQVAGKFDHSIFVSEKEAELFRQRVNGRPISVVSNGVDLNYFAPVKGEGKKYKRTIVFTGAMDYFPNIDAVSYFCAEILPLISTELSDVQFYIVGRNPSSGVKKLGDRKNVTVTGGVPDIRPYLAGAGVAVAPFRIARGVQNKVLEAMAMGLPVVGTSITFQGVRAGGEDGIRITDDPKRFAGEVVSMLSAPEIGESYGRRARMYVEKHHRWEDQLALLDSIIRKQCPKSL